jgi:sugar/nucleoside kinase (ribokinase family)
MNDYHVVGIGGLYLDVVAPVSYGFIKKHGINLNEEHEVSQETLQKVFFTLKNKELFAGGSAANTVSGMASLGARVGFFTKVAADPIGQALIQNFKRSGVELCCPPVDPKASLSPSCLILTTPQGERSILFHAENPTRFSDNELASIAKTRCAFLLFEAAILLEKQNRLPALLEVVCAARKNGAKTVFNLQGSYSWKELTVLPRDIASMSDIIIGNEAEVAALEKHVMLPSFSEQTVVMTQGQNGATLKAKESLLHVKASHAVQVIDSIGAGDQFLAGFLHALCLGLSPRESMEAGSRTACSILGSKGGRPNAAIRAALI